MRSLADMRAHRLIDQVNVLERMVADATRFGATHAQVAKLQRRIKVLDQRAWKMSSDPLLEPEE